MNIIYKKTNYPSNLTGEQWHEIESFFPYGNHCGIHKRSMVEAVLYIVKTGCPWCSLPSDFPKWCGKIFLLQSN